MTAPRPLPDSFVLTLGGVFRAYGCPPPSSYTEVDLGQVVEVIRDEDGEWVLHGVQAEAREGLTPQDEGQARDLWEESLREA